MQFIYNSHPYPVALCSRLLSYVSYHMILYSTPHIQPQLIRSGADATQEHPVYGMAKRCNQYDSFSKYCKQRKQKNSGSFRLVINLECEAYTLHWGSHHGLYASIESQLEQNLTFKKSLNPEPVQSRKLRTCFSSCCTQGFVWFFRFPWVPNHVHFFLVISRTLPFPSSNQSNVIFTIKEMCIKIRRYYFYLQLDKD